MHAAPKVVVTGGPCVGKSTQLAALAEHTGLPVAEEEARPLIDSGKFCLNTQWEHFQFELVRRQMESEEKLHVHGKPIFCDRGIYDSLAYSRKKGRIPDFLLTLPRPRYALAFLLEPLGFFINDGTRTEDLKFTEAITPLLEEAYIEHGVTVVRVKSGTVAERLDFMLAKTSEILRVTLPRIK
jgi:predicted ATPase